MRVNVQMLVLLVAVVFSSQLVFAQNFPCNFQGTKGNYDLSALNGTQITGSDAAGVWNYFLSMCAIAPGSQTQPCVDISGRSLNAMVCQVNQDPNYGAYAIAYPNDQTRTHEWTELSNGIQLTAFGGLSFGCKYNAKNAQIQVTCDPQITKVPLNFSAAIVENKTTCTYTLQLTHASGCPTTATNKF